MRKNTNGLRRGGPGRPKGVPNKATVEAREFARAFIADAEYQANLRKRILAGQANHLESLLWQYGYGRPREMDKPTGAGSLQIVYMGVGRNYDPLADKSRMLAKQRAERQAAALPAASRAAASIPSKAPDSLVDENGEEMDML